MEEGTGGEDMEGEGGYRREDIGGGAGGFETRYSHVSALRGVSLVFAMLDGGERGGGRGASVGVYLPLSGW